MNYRQEKRSDLYFRDGMTMTLDYSSMDANVNILPLRIYIFLVTVPSDYVYIFQ